MPHLLPLFQNDRMKYLKYKVLPTCEFFPAKEDIFNVFSMPLDHIKVCVLGQDPYPQPKQAIGYAFAVPENVEMPFSLRVINNEVDNMYMRLNPNVNDLQVHPILEEWKTLKHWRDQGVFLLNTALTVEKNNPNSHKQYWGWFIHQVVEIISKEVKPIWLLWGANAKGHAAYIPQASFYQPVEVNSDVMTIVSLKGNVILTAPHPAAEAYGNKTKFSGCNHFELTNQILQTRGQKPILW